MDTVKLWKKVYANFTNCEIHNKLIFRNQLYSIRYAAAVERLAASNLKRAEAAEARATELTAQLQSVTTSIDLEALAYKGAIKRNEELAAQLATAQDDTDAAIDSAEHYKHALLGMQTTIDSLAAQLERVTIERNGLQAALDAIGEEDFK